ncbi:lysostaphin resistance A-like protein [Zhouia sp. PK063]|uniref:lysostaphin resistance A-like protein n=1 Tax=Zhouia sp. PK063 TaxID=3373602 RepID=UPI00378B4C53
MDSIGEKGNLWNTKLMEVLVILFVVLFPHYMPLPFYSYAIVCFLVVYLKLRAEGKKIKDLGLSRKDVNGKALLIGLLSAGVWVAFMRWVYMPTIRLMVEVPAYTEYNFIQEHFTTFLWITVAAWIVGGFYEEIIFRGYIQNTLERWFDSRYAFWWAAVITSVLFGLYHIQQGWFGVVAGILGGLYWTWIYKLSGKRLWYTIFSHAIFDTITLTLIYLDVFQ